MTPLPADPHPATAGALAEPQTPARGWFLALLGLANLGIMVAFYTPIQNLIPRLAEQIDPDGKEAAVGLILGLGVIGSVIGNPLAGALSDRTTSRFGRRRPWLLGGSLLGMVAIFLLPGQTSVPALIVLWLFVQFAVNAAYAALTASIPDQVPVPQRGVASGWVGMGQTLGVVLGVALVSFVVVDLAGGTYLIGVLFVLLVIPFLVVLPDTPLAKADRPPFHLREFLVGFWISPKRYPDFAWAWLARFLVQLGLSMATLYLLFYLQDHLGFGSEEAGQRQTVLIGLYAAGTAATAIIGGKISDRSGKRRIFVAGATVIIAVAALLLSFAQSFGLTVVAALILGIGNGWYLAVDQALITQVLPTARDRARDLGVINIANSLPQVLAPVLAFPFVTWFGGYPALYVATAVVALAGAVAVLPIRSVP